MKITVAIPTFNGVQRLPLVIDHLNNQRNADKIAWEILIVDNNSTDETSEKLNEWLNDWQFPWPLKITFEHRQGAGYARHHAISVARGDYVAFLDDDNLPEASWLDEVSKFIDSSPHVGAFNGQIIGDLEGEIPHEFDAIKSFLAIREHNESPVINPSNLQLLPSAGLVVKRIAWLSSLPDTLVLGGRVGSSLVGGEDYEALLWMSRQGWAIEYAPKLVIHHRIPRHRLKKEYLTKLAYSIGLSTYSLRTILAEPYHYPLIFLKTILGNIRRILIHLKGHPFKAKNSLSLQVKLAFYYGGFLSPFYYIKQRLLAVFQH